MKHQSLLVKLTFCFLLFGVVLIFSVIVLSKQPILNVDEDTSNQQNVSQILPTKIENGTLFDKAQYYFNQDEDQAPPYDLETAEYYFKKAIEEDPASNPLLWYQAGRVDFINGNFDEALSKFDTQVQYFGDQVPNVYYMIGLTNGYKARIAGYEGDWKKAEDGFQKSITFFPGAPWPYVDLAWIYFSQGKFTQMKPLLEEAFTHDSNNAWLLNMYGLALLNTGDKLMAREYFLFAQEQAEELTVEDWSRSYPGNDPQLWEPGLNEFKSLIAKNVALTEK